MPDEEAILEANAAFYRAFDRRDLEAMGKLWAERVPVACIHPGWAPVHGREEVLASFKGIFEGPSPPRIACLGARAYRIGESAFVICTERLEDGALVATNVFALEQEGWRVVHHQAGPLPPVVDPPATGTVH